MHISNSFISHMIANGYIVYKRSRRFFKLRLLFALVSTCICICIPHRVVATTRMYSDSKRTIGNRYGSDMVRVTLFIHVCAQVVHAFGAWLNDVPFSFEELHSLKSAIAEVRRIGLHLLRANILRNPENLGISWSWRKGKNQRSLPTPLVSAA